MAELSLDNIFTADEADFIFGDDSQETLTEGDGESSEDTKEEKEEKDTTEVNPETIFSDEPESVGSEDKEEKEDTNSEKGGTSPDFYSSLAKALTEEGIFPDLDNEVISKVTTPEDFRDLIDQQIQAGLDEKQKRIDDALNAGLEPAEIKKYENTLSYLNNITEDNLENETEEGEVLRKNLIYQDYINKGFTKEKATKMVERAIRAGTDLEDAKEALESNKEYFQDQYNSLVKEAKKQEEEIKKERRQQIEALKESILTDKKVFGDIDIDKKTRQKIYETITKPVYRDPDTGQAFTAIQKYERENSTDFLKYVGLLYTMTDGFKNLDRLVKGKVQKEVKKGMRELESKLSGTMRTSDGQLRFANGADDPESWLKEYTIDI